MEHDSAKPSPGRRAPRRSNGGDGSKPSNRSPGLVASRQTSVMRQLLVLLCILAPLTLVVSARMPVTYPEGDFVRNVIDVARTGHVSSTFTPDTYPYLAGLAYKAGGVRGFLLLQATGYLLLAACLLFLLRSLAGPVHARISLIAAVVICLDPDLLSSIPKVWDTELTCLLLIAFAGLGVAAERRPSALRLLALATLWGLGVSVRPNFALLLLPVVYLLVLERVRSKEKAPVRWVTLFFKMAAVAAWGCVVALSINRVSHGSFYVAQNGPYNLFAGANPYSRTALLEHYNAESSVPPALAALGLHVTYPYDLALRSTYTHSALLFMRSHPGQWLVLCAVKLGTLLRPDTKAHAAGTAGWCVKVLTSLCVPLWLVTLAVTRKLKPIDTLMIVIAAGYILPFLLTNADPRFRPPLDVLVLCHTASLLARRFAPEPGRRSPAPGAA